MKLVIALALLVLSAFVFTTSNLGWYTPFIAAGAVAAMWLCASLRWSSTLLLWIYLALGISWLSGYLHWEPTLLFIQATSAVGPLAFAISSLRREVNRRRTVARPIPAYGGTQPHTSPVGGEV